MKHIKLFEQFVNEAKMPDKLIGNDEIVFLKTKEDSRGANYNLYYKGHDIDAGGRRFGSEKELKAFADDYILSNQWYNKLKYEDSKPLPESFVNESGISDAGYALNRLADNQVGGVPATEFQEEHNLDIDALTRAIVHTKEITRYELRDIIQGTAPKSKIKRFLKTYVMESVVNEAEKAKGDRGPIDNEAIETGLKNKAKETGVPIDILRIVMRRGMDAWNSSHRPGVGQEQWGYARLNAFLEKGKPTWEGSDADVAKEVRDGGYDKKLPYKFD
jgi:hypothetical protein